MGTRENRLGEAVLRVPTIYVLSKYKKNSKTFLMKIFISYNFKNLCILHGHVFVMTLSANTVINVDETSLMFRHSLLLMWAVKYWSRPVRLWEVYRLLVRSTDQQPDFWSVTALKVWA